MALTIGLGRNSPIPLEGDPKKYEGLIVRHGQWTRWMSARKCTCILASNRPDPRCTRCRGLGWRYSFQTDEEDVAVEAQIVDANTIELPYEVEASRVTLIQDGARTVYHLSEAYGRWIRVAETFPDNRGMVYVSVLKNRSATMEGPIGVYLGHGLIQIDSFEYQNPWAKVPIDIISVHRVTSLTGIPFNVLDFAVDKIMLDPEQIYFADDIDGGESGTLFTQEVDGGEAETEFDEEIDGGRALMEPSIGERMFVSLTYMPPYRIAIINQAISEMDQRSLQEVGGDAMALFPYSYKVSEQDVITSWASSQVRKRILRKAVGDVDVLPDLFVSKILHLEDANREYLEGTHFVVWDRNTIRWIVATASRPAEGANFSIEYAANATYRVVRQFPNIRASEDKRFPQRVGVKLEAGITGSDQV